MWYYWVMLAGGLIMGGCTIIGLIGSARADRWMRRQWIDLEVQADDHQDSN